MEAGRLISAQLQSGAQIKHKISLKELENCRNPLTWLSTDIFDSYLELITIQSRGKMHFVTTNVMQLYRSEFRTDQEKMELINEMIIEQDWSFVKLVFLPVNLHGNHWAMAVYDHETNKFVIFDSNNRYEGTTDEKLNFMITMKGLLRIIFQQKGLNFVEPESYEEIRDIPQQTNGNDCGVFALMYAFYMAEACQILNNFNSCMEAAAFREKIYNDIYAIHL